MNLTNRITELFGIRYPIIQGGMVWVSGWRLASAVSNSGCLGLIGAGSMKPDLLREHIRKTRAATKNPFGVNLPLLRGDVEDLIQIILEEKVRILFTSAGSPSKYTELFKGNGIIVAHLVSNLKFALKAEQAGCDAAIGEGVEAGGHNGADELSTISLIPMLRDKISIPLIAAGGINDGRGIVAAMALGADGVQIGTRFAVTQESSAHQKYKTAILNAESENSKLILKKIGLVRTLGNELAVKILKAEESGASAEELREILGTKKERLGIFEGNETEGLLESGQGLSLIKDIPCVEELVKRMLGELRETISRLNGLKGIFNS